MGKLILIRHSAVELEPGVPAHRWRLSMDGRARCLLMAPALAAFKPDLIVTSHEPKAIETGRILAGVLGLPCEAADGLHEHDRRGTPFFEKQEAFAAAVAAFFAQPDQLLFGRETAVQAGARFVNAVTRLTAQYPEKKVAVVAHGTVITLFLASFNAFIDPFELWCSLTLPCFFVVSPPQMKLKQSWFTCPAQGR
ncbi:MAG: histidine phosphatase family protein [Anaerolineae bacterium]